mmetsp:Transcript_36030/g.93738  ORF Transcript_36030/g.93738 Transcript_36030/m.93738 type:complete len:430 (-) Transcript_36030:304-1593(-)
MDSPPPTSSSVSFHVPETPPRLSTAGIEKARARLDADLLKTERRLAQEDKGRSSLLSAVTERKREVQKERRQREPPLRLVQRWRRHNDWVLTTSFLGVTEEAEGSEILVSDLEGVTRVYKDRSRRNVAETEEDYSFQPHRVLDEHTKSVNTSLVFDRKLFTGGRDKVICAWNLERDYFLSHKLEGHEFSILSLSVVKDGSDGKPFLVSVDYSGALFLWDIKGKFKSQKLYSKLYPREGRPIVAPLVTSTGGDDHFIYCGPFGGLSVFTYRGRTIDDSMIAFEETVVMEREKGTVCEITAAVSVGSSAVIAAAQDGQLRRFKRQEDRESIKYKSEANIAFAFESSIALTIRCLVVVGDYLWGGDSAGRLTQWSLDNLEVVRSFPAHRLQITSMSLLFTDALLTASEDLECAIWMIGKEKEKPQKAILIGD